MEEDDLDCLADLLDEDDYFNEHELASLHTDEEQARNDLSQEKTNNMSDSDDDNKEDITKKVTEMQKYIKYLESQLKTQNKSNSPESTNGVEMHTAIESTPNTRKKKSTNNETHTQNSNKECSSEFKKTIPKKSSSSETSTSSTKKESPYDPTKGTSSTTPNNSRRPCITMDSVTLPSTTPQRSSDTGKKQRVAHTPKMFDKVESSKTSTEMKSGGKKRKAEGAAPFASAPKKSAQESSGITDGYSGIRILNPLISSAAMERRMDGRKMIKISSIQSKIKNNDIEGDWVTVGVLVQKLPPKTSVKGSQYSIWKLSDLAFHLQNSTVSFFLFGECHKELWKTSEGSVVAFLNPSILPSKEKQSNDVALTIDNPKRMMLMGMSQDFGRCQGARKSDGSKCSNFINKSFGNFCQYHVRREYNKIRSKRMECQQGYGAPKGPKSNLKKKIASESFFYEGRTVSSYVPPPQRNKVTLKSLGTNANKDHLNSWKEKQDSESKKSGDSLSENNGPSEDFLNLLKIPTAGSRNLMRQLHQEEEKEEKETHQTVSATEFLKANKVGERTPCSPVTSSRTPVSKESQLSRTPVLGRGLNCDDDLIFDENVPLNMSLKRSTDMDKGKRKALALVREAGPFTPQDPNTPRPKKPSPKLQNAINDKLEKSNTSDPGVVKSSSFTLADGFDLESSEAQKILKTKSRHVGQVKKAEIQQEQKYFESREKKEAMEDKMNSITQLKVNVFHCLQCKYIAEKPSDRCSTEQHTVKRLNVFKKFFECRDCKERTVAYGQRYPTHECRKCGAKNFQKCSMWKEKSGPKIGGETLLLRGPEYSRFLNSLESPKTNGVLPKYL